MVKAAISYRIIHYEDSSVKLLAWNAIGRYKLKQLRRLFECVFEYLKVFGRIELTTQIICDYLYSVALQLPLHRGIAKSRADEILFSSLKTHDNEQEGLIPVMDAGLCCRERQLFVEVAGMAGENRAFYCRLYSSSQSAKISLDLEH
jgi:hypothetical protein